MERVPQTIDHNVKRLIWTLRSAERPVYLDVRPEPFAKAGECFPSVKEKVRRHGGSMQLGWQIWQIPDIMIEAEFHAVWKSPDGELIDITPKKYRIDHILFVPDCETGYYGAHRNNKKLNISGNRLVDDFIEICDARYRLLNKGGRTYKDTVLLSEEECEVHKMLSYSRDLVSTMVVQGSTRYSPCVCGSGKEYRHCHGSILVNLLDIV